MSKVDLLEATLNHKAVAVGIVFSLFVAFVFAVVLVMSSATSTGAHGSASTHANAHDKSTANRRGESAEQIAAIERYDDEKKKTVKTLASAHWTGADGTSTMKIEGNYIVEHVPSGKDASKTVRQAFAIEGEFTNSEAMPQDGSLSERDLVILLSNGDHSILRLFTVTPTDDGVVSDASYETLSGSFLENSKGYTNRFAWRDLKIDGIKDHRLTSALDGRDKALIDALKNHLRVHHPTVHRIRWTRSIGYDYSAGTVTASFDLDAADSPAEKALTSCALSVVFTPATENLTITETTGATS